MTEPQLFFHIYFIDIAVFISSRW